MITLKYNFKSLQKGLYEIVQNAVKIVSQFIWSSESLYYKNRVTKPKTNQPNLKNWQRFIKVSILAVVFIQSMAINPKYGKRNKEKYFFWFRRFRLNLSAE